MVEVSETLFPARVLWAFVATLPIRCSLFVSDGGDIIDNVRVGCNRVRTSACIGRWSRDIIAGTTSQVVTLAVVR